MALPGAGQSAAMDVLGKHRIGFNNLGVQLFADLERDLSLALTKGES